MEKAEMEVQANEVAQMQMPRILSQEERNDLRKRVLAGDQLTLEEAKQVIASAKQGQAVAILESGEKKAKARTSKSSKPSLSDDALDAQLSNLGL
jgi:hypothetical protein